MKKAIINEVNSRYIEAVEGYEDEIENRINLAEPDSFINLAFLGWM